MDHAVQWSRVASMTVNERKNCEKSIEMQCVSIVRPLCGYSWFRAILKYFSFALRVA